MQPAVLIREPEPLDTERVATIMRAIDRRECRAAGLSPWGALVEAQRMSALCWTGEVDGFPHAMFGVVPTSAATGVGSPWFLGSEVARRNARLFLVEAPKYLARIETIFPRLEGYVHAENKAAHRWLLRMGFNIEYWSRLMNGEPMFSFTKGD